MKHVVSVSLGSTSRDHSMETDVLGEKFKIERIGTNGDMNKAIEIITNLDGKVDAFGMGGIDLYIHAGRTRYTLKDAKKIANAAIKTPIVDGSGLKNTLERKVINYLKNDIKFDFTDKKVLMVSGVDRFGMSEALTYAGATVTYGDLIFGLGLPLPLNSLKALERAARILAPVICRMPFKLLYPTGEKQEVIIPKYTQYYLNNDIISGDFLFIKRHLPEQLPGKIIITNTVTEEDIVLLQQRGLKMLITSTPEFNGRSFGTNVMEAVLIAFSAKRDLTPEEYSVMLDQIGFQPRVIKFTDERYK